jgi:peptide deformylase
MMMSSSVLTSKAKRVKKFDKGLRNLVDKMVTATKNNGALGLAAPQINEPLQVIIANYEDKIYVLVNPVIIRYSNEKNTETERCLSLQGFSYDVERSNWIIVKGYDQYKKKVKIKAEGMLARIFQHEVDHINGLLIVDRGVKKDDPINKPEEFIHS